MFNNILAIILILVSIHPHEDLHTHSDNPTDVIKKALVNNRVIEEDEE